MALATYALTTLARVKTLLNISGSTYDTLLEDIINAVTDAIENQCSRRFAETTHTEEQIDGTGKPSLFVKFYPITIFTKLEVRTGKTTWVEVDSDDYRINSDTGELQLTGDTREGFRNYRATYDAGFTTIPYDLDMAAAQMAAHEFNTRGQGGGQIESESLGDYTVSYRKGTDESDKFIDGVIEKYKKYKV